MANDYLRQRKIENEGKIRQLQRELPACVTDFMRSLITERSDLTRLEYIKDLRTFFCFLPRELPAFADLQPYQITPDELNKLTLRDFEAYKEYLMLYDKPDARSQSKSTGSSHRVSAHKAHYVTNAEAGLGRKISSLRAFFRYLYLHDLISENITEKLSVPSAAKKEIIYLNREEIEQMIDAVNTCDGMPENQKKYLAHTKARDTAILCLLLGTGIRASEMVGLDFSHINMEHRSFVVSRKGGKEMTLYFNEDVERALADYLAVRETIVPAPGSENALFLSLQRKRLTTRALQYIIKKYGQIAVPYKHKISPHKMRSSFGTALYEASGDINLVANVLGHSNVNTTQKHYVHTAEEQREKAAKLVDWTTPDE